MRIAYGIAVVVVSLLSSNLKAAATGPDVIVGFIDDAREDSRLGSKIGLTASTNSCNIGDSPLNWQRLPDTHHPAITLNFYRLADGRMEQLAKSWVKHGFYATNQNDCGGIPEMHRTCQAGAGGSQLRPGCSDLYTEDLNSDPRNLGPRSRITNSAKVEFDGSKAQDLTGYPPSDPAERILLVDEADLLTPGARYFVEAQYITADDATAGNARNNVTYREVKPILRSGAWVLRNESPEVRMQPALFAWKEYGAQLSEVDLDENGVKTYILVGSKAQPLAGGKFRYDYSVYNMNSDLAVQAFAVPEQQIDQSSASFKAPHSNGEIWSNDAWDSRIQGNQIIWSTRKSSEDTNANAVRWGSAYNFSFVSDKPPTTADATLTFFNAPADGGAETVVRVTAPGQ
ncbi:MULTISPECIES: hypothetical protein [Mesorhizobium]|uniref:hypothetical protein n=1 Tax=Mesorhizobium TaxID=68287 RepID=UPI0007EE1926|nr:MULTISPECIES: hypothetical protein [Mesorhizobium]TPJ43842.1 hypothetical protein FJ437_19350 [Mesorhizobium sp. B2-6-6]ARP67094.1 hypothetical protein A9K65_029895 [Mesorhizobium sp. WSM1497]MCA0002169.1 hypothetical protein [Mesorhizobium sp. B264B2A]MCA0008870.1 hypothetical protein [Mesorhizobium sp. B264B1B]MCA0015409.1 hypothetical protein [Mesorhizobium sp. B294B1A1]